MKNNIIESVHNCFYNLKKRILVQWLLAAVQLFFPFSLQEHGMENLDK